MGRKVSRNSADNCPGDDVDIGCFSFVTVDQKGGSKICENSCSDDGTSARRMVQNDGFSKNGLNNGKGKDEYSLRFMAKNLLRSKRKAKIPKEVCNDVVERLSADRVKRENKQKRSNIHKADSPIVFLRVGLDLCSKRGDVVSAIRLYDLARMVGVKMGQYHYAVLLYLCSSAATGTVLPAKSGSGSRCPSPVNPSSEGAPLDFLSCNVFGETKKDNYGLSKPYDKNMPGNLFVKLLDRNEPNVNDFTTARVSGYSHANVIGEKEVVNGSLDPSPDTLGDFVESMKMNADYLSIKDGRNEGLTVSEDVKRIALCKGFEIYDQMRVEKVPMNEATLTSVARLAIALRDGDMAFDTVKQMKSLGLNPRLRSYGPALSVFCNIGDIEKAFLVEKHMLEHNVNPEESELALLLKVSVKAGDCDKVYYVMHKLRTSVRQVSPDTADLFESWFNSKVASRVGKRKWDREVIAQAIENGGGGWHGKGWLGKGKWTVCRSPVGSDGVCKLCGEKLATIDLDPVETENFAKSVAAIAAQREKHSNFQKFQKWLDYYGPFEAVVDAANVGLYCQRSFKPSKVNAVANGIRQSLTSRKWPLIVLHNRRVVGEKMDEPVNKSLIEKWKNADALFLTPTGSNDDWYWLYAAIKCRCLLVTNDEMRDHLFQLLGNDIFPKWKERHQVRFTFDETGPVFGLPPPCSVVIQESEKGHWHIPIASELVQEDQRIWLCCTRKGSRLDRLDSEEMLEGSRRATAGGRLDNLRQSKKLVQELSSNIKNIVLSSNNQSILPELETAEKLGKCLIDFQI